MKEIKATGHAGPESVAKSRKEHGANVLTPPPGQSAWSMFLGNFEDPVIHLLLMADVIAMLTGQVIEAIGIAVAILLATGIAFLNEWDAKRKFDVLNETSDDVGVTVIRGGEAVVVRRRDVVVGDLVRVDAGDEIPADGTFVDCFDLRVDESALTGESVPASKSAEGGGDGAYGADMALRGSFVKEGYGHMVVARVGDATEMGRTARSVMEEGGEPTPLDNQLDKLARLIGVVGFGFAGAVFLSLVALGTGTTLTATVSQSVMVWGCVTGMLVATAKVWLPVVVFDSLSLAGVDAEVPVALDGGGWKSWGGFALAGFVVCLVGFVVSMILADGEAVAVPASTWEALLEYFMIATAIIVAAVPEGLAMSVTLAMAYSMRKMMLSGNLVRRLPACETAGSVTRICTDKTGTLTVNRMTVSSLRGDHRDILTAAAINSTAEKSSDGFVGNPTEVALLDRAESFGLDVDGIRESFPVVSRHPFSSDRKYMMTETAVDGKPVVFVKGAPEAILGMCAMEEGERKAILGEMAVVQSDGARTIGFARAEATGDDFASGKADLVFTGFAAISDPVRDDVPEAVARVRGAGIEVVMVTGDVKETAIAVARLSGIVDGDCPDCHTISGDDFEALGEEERLAVCLGIKVMYRAKPSSKLALVKALQARGEVVAVTGDGTNDGPAMAAAHVSFSMGKSGTAIAREASDVVLLDDSFADIGTAVMWGRSLYRNIQRFITFQLTTNVSTLAIALAGPFVGVSLPLTVTQLLWVNLIMDTLAALALASEPPDESVMLDAPRKPDAFIITGEMAKMVFGIGGAFVAVLVCMLLCMDMDDPVSLTVFFTVFVLLQGFNLFNTRMLGRDGSGFVGLAGSPHFLAVVVTVFIGQFLIVTFGGAVFRTVPLGAGWWTVTLAACSLVAVVGEVARTRRFPIVGGKVFGRIGTRS